MNTEERRAQITHGLGKNKYGAEFVGHIPLSRTAHSLLDRITTKDYPQLTILSDVMGEVVESGISDKDRQLLQDQDKAWFQKVIQKKDTTADLIFHTTILLSKEIYKIKYMAKDENIGFGATLWLIAEVGIRRRIQAIDHSTGALVTTS